MNQTDTTSLTWSPRMEQRVGCGSGATTAAWEQLPSTPELQEWLGLYRAMVAARCLDKMEAALVSRGEAFFHVSGAGHEGSALLHRYLTAADWLHAHYRDKALLLARGVPAEQFLHGLLCTAASSSAGRQMSAHLSDPQRHILSMVAPVGNHALQAVGVASAVKHQAQHPIVLCSMGDGTSQQGEVLEAIAEAVRSTAPVLFWIEDNGYAISTRTAHQTFYDLPGAANTPGSFYGLPIHRLDGRNLLQCDSQLADIIDQMRITRQPALVVFSVERLCNHTNADDERVYRSDEERASAQSSGDPIPQLREWLLLSGCSEDELQVIEETARRQIESAAEAALLTALPTTCLEAKQALPPCLTSVEAEYRGNDTHPRLTMLEGIREVLRHRLATDRRVTLLGEDIEAPKGDVFGVTRGLSTEFPGRVRNSALSESTILGTSIGRALAGERPVAFIQFADFLPLAFNQLASELGSMFWRTNGGWSCPVIVMVACGAYRPGLGPFHAQTFESLIAHVPGIDVVMPSTAADAAGLLNAAFTSGRPTLFFYPKVCLNDRDTGTSCDVQNQLVPLGKARFVTRGDELTLVTWGSTVPLCEKAVQVLTAHGASVDLLDLRSISPWDQQAVCASAARTGRLLVVHEDNRTCGFGAEVAATAAEAVRTPLTIRRITRPDTYVPCNFNNQLELLPSLQRILETAADLLNFELTWRLPQAARPSTLIVEAIGSSPADQNVTVIEWNVRDGDRVSAGEVLAQLEAEKAMFELRAPGSGLITNLTAPGQPVSIGQALAMIQTEQRDIAPRSRRSAPATCGEPLLIRRQNPAIQSAACPDTSTPATPASRAVVGLSAVYTAEGSDVVTNAALARQFSERTEGELFKLTGIETRRRLAANESLLSIATRAAAAALKGENLSLCDLSAIICSTSTPPATCPSLACLVHHELGQSQSPHDLVAFDISAACSGYLYALAAAFDFLQQNPSAKVMVLTAEAMSRVVNPADFDTAILFGDAATATILYGREALGKAKAKLHRPVIGAHGENGSALRVSHADGVVMNGRKVFPEAVRRMLEMLERACEASSQTLASLHRIIPHQANGRIIDAVRARTGLPSERFVNQIRHRGNTSSSSIPQCLGDLLQQTTTPSTVGLCAFGGGFTFGAAIVELAS